jgi:hypothetical protein
MKYLSTLIIIGLASAFSACAHKTNERKPSSENMKFIEVGTTLSVSGSYTFKYEPSDPSEKEVKAKHHCVVGNGFDTQKVDCTLWMTVPKGAGYAFNQGDVLIMKQEAVNDEFIFDTPKGHQVHLQCHISSTYGKVTSSPLNVNVVNACFRVKEAQFVFTTQELKIEPIKYSPQQNNNAAPIEI